MSTTTARAPAATSVERTEPGADFGAPKNQDRPPNTMQGRRRWIEGIGLAVAVVATLVTYGLFIAYPVSHEPLNAFLAQFARYNAAIWPMFFVWYASAVAIVVLALRPGRRSTQVISMLAAAYFAWIGIAYFGTLASGTHVAWVSGLLAGGFVLEGILFVVAGLLRSDLVVAPRRDVASALGAVFIAYALVGYPIIGMLGGHALSMLPLFGLSPCASVIFSFGLLLWARPPAPLYLLPIPLAWAFAAAPTAMATGVVVDVGLVVAGVITALVILWRDRTSTVQTVVGGLALALMIVWSGHEDVLMLLALVLVAVTLAQAIWGRAPLTASGEKGEGSERGLPEPLGASSGRANG